MIFLIFSQKKRAFGCEDALGSIQIVFFLPQRRRGAEAFIFKKTPRLCGKKNHRSRPKCSRITGKLAQD
jgi:hypothetical protein